MALTKKQLNFIDHYLKTNDAVGSVISAGFSPKGAATAAWRVMRDPEVVEELDKRRKEYVKERGLSKQTFIEYALNDYENVDVASPNRPRFLTLAGQASGIIGSDNSPSQTLNISLTKNTLNVTNAPKEMLEHLTNMLEAE